MQLSRKRLLLSLLALCWCGCEEFRPRPVPDVDVRELLEPVRIKIHHSSSVERKDAGGDFDGLVVACEVKDRFGDQVKALGVMRFEVYAYARSQPKNKGSRIGFWPNVSIDSLESTQQHWDNVWGLYRFNLEWQQEVKEKDRFVLKATLTTPEGKQFTNTLVLEVRP